MNTQKQLKLIVWQGNKKEESIKRSENNFEII